MQIVGKTVDGDRLRITVAEDRLHGPRGRPTLPSCLSARANRGMQGVIDPPDPSRTLSFPPKGFRRLHRQSSPDRTEHGDETGQGHGKGHEWQ